MFEWMCDQDQTILNEHGVLTFSGIVKIILKLKETTIFILPLPSKNQALSDPLPHFPE